MSSKKNVKPNKGGGKFNHPKKQGANHGSAGGGGGGGVGGGNARPSGAMEAVGRKGGRGFDLTELDYGPDDDDDHDDDDGKATTFNDAGICGWKAGAEKK